MAILDDANRTGAGEVTTYFPSPLTIYTEVVTFGNARSRDVQPGGRWHDLGWWGPQALGDLGSGLHAFLYLPIWIEAEFSGVSLHVIAPGGTDGYRWRLAPGVEVRFVVTDD